MIVKSGNIDVELDYLTRDVGKLRNWQWSTFHVSIR